MLLCAARRAARRSASDVRRRILPAQRRCSSTGACASQPRGRRSGLWGPVAALAVVAAVSASGGDKAAQNQSTKRYSRNIRASYDLLEKTVGTGGFGHVVAGVHRETGEHVAVKFISKKVCSRDRVMSEVDILRVAGEHANIISYYGFYEDDENYYIVMEMARGGELFDQLVEYGAYSESQARTTVKAIVDALSYLHQQRIAHLDLKPENVMLTVPVPRVGGKDADTELDIDIGPLIRIVDFGSAARIDNKRGVVKFGSGTVAYSPPELLNGKPAGDKADIWSLGVIMFIMLRGFHPFDPFNDANDDVVQQRIIDHELPLHAFTWEGLSKPAKTLIMRMLDPDPDKRPTALELLSDEWFLSDALSTDLLEVTAENLRRFHRGRRRLKAILLSIMADLLPTDVHRRTKSLGSRRSAIRWIDYDNKEYVTAQDLTRACRLLGEGTTEREKRELATSMRRRQTVNVDHDAQDMLFAANGTGNKQRKIARYQDLMHLLPPLCPGRVLQQDEMVYNVGDEDLYFYLLKEGTISLMAPAGNARERTEDEPTPLRDAVDISKGDHFGHLELLETVTDNRARSHAARCSSHECKVFEISPSEFSLLTDVFAPVAHRLTAKAETIAQALALAHLKTTKEYKMVMLDHPMTAQELSQQTFPGEPVILFVVDGSLEVHTSATQTASKLAAGRFIALHEAKQSLDLSVDCPPMLHPQAEDKLVPSKNPKIVDTMLLAVPLSHARDILESPALHAIRHNLPS